MGYKFDDKNREIIIDKYNTPTPWMNYFSNGTFHTMMSQAGGGVAFYKSPQIWRINHYRFFHLPTDRSGFYAYIKDGNNVWTPTSEPCACKPEKWNAAHGMGYSRYTATKNGVNVVATYFVGKYENALADQAIKSAKKGLQIKRKRKEELSRLMQLAYEDRLKGKMPEDICIGFIQKYSDEQKRLENEITELEERLTETTNTIQSADDFIRNIKKYLEAPELTRRL